MNAFGGGDITAVMNMGALQIVNMPNGGTRFTDEQSGEGFHLSATGERMSIADGLDCECGEEFTYYVRHYLDPFPYSRYMPQSREIRELWPDRKLILLKTGGGDAPQQGNVVSWRERNTGPLSHCTSWELTFCLSKRENSKTFSIGDLVEIVDESKQDDSGKRTSDSKEDDKMIGTVTKYDKQSKKYEVLRRKYKRGEGSYVDIKASYEDEALKLVEKLEMNVSEIDVHKGGTLSVPKEYGMAEILEFEWLAPPFPRGLGADSCTHGTDASNLTDFQQGFKEYVDIYFSYGTMDMSSVPKHTTPAVEEFVQEHGHLITEPFCNFVYAQCLEMYLIGSLTGKDVREDLRAAFTLATNLRYRYIPEKNGEAPDIDKISKYSRDIHTERGVAKTLAKEISCPCADDLLKISRKMKKVGKCFGCREEMDKDVLMECSKCRFARYCGRDCQVQDWNEHKAVCKVIRKKTRMVKND